MKLLNVNLSEFQIIFAVFLMIFCLSFPLSSHAENTPELSCVSFFGDTVKEYGWAVAADADGAVYMAGYDETGTETGNDAFVCKISPDGSGIVYSTPPMRAEPVRITDGAFPWIGEGNAYVTGFSDSVNFPVRNAIQSMNAGGNDIIVFRLNPEGNDMI